MPGLTVLPPQRTGLGDFTEAFNPYLQMAFENLMKKKLLEEEFKRQKELKMMTTPLEQQKLEQDTLQGIAKGELPPSVVPQSLLRPQSLNTQGLGGNVQALQNLSPTAQVSGTPEFMKRYNPQQTPQDFASNLQSTYAKQQQAINPYKALQGETVGARQQVSALLDSGTSWEQIPIQLKIMAGYAAKEGGGMNFNFGTETPNSKPIPKYDPKKEKLQYNSETGEYRVVPK